MKGSNSAGNNLENEKIRIFFSGNYSEENEMHLNDIFCYKTKAEELRQSATFTDENPEVVLDSLKQSLPVEYKILKGNLCRDNVFAKKKVIIFHRLN